MCTHLTRLQIEFKLRFYSDRHQNCMNTELFKMIFLKGFVSPLIYKKDKC